MQNSEKINDAINETMKNFTVLSDADVIIGKPLLTPNGTTIIPVSKMTVGFLFGNGEYGKVKIFQPNKNYPSSTASGGLTSVKPCGFLVEKGESLRFIHCPDDVYEKAFNSIEEFIKKINEK